MDTDRIRGLAESAENRASNYHLKAQLADVGYTEHTATYYAFMNDWAYWIGHANAYRGIIAMIELQTVVEDERDAEPTCP